MKAIVNETEDKADINPPNKAFNKTQYKTVQTDPGERWKNGLEKLVHMHRFWC